MMFFHFMHIVLMTKSLKDFYAFRINPKGSIQTYKIHPLTTFPNLIHSTMQLSLMEQTFLSKCWVPILMHKHLYNQVCQISLTNSIALSADMEKGGDTRTLSAEIFENCGNFLIVEDYAPLFSEKKLFLVEMFDET